MSRSAPCAPDRGFSRGQRRVTGVGATDRESWLTPLNRGGEWVQAKPAGPPAAACSTQVGDPARGGETIVRLLVERDGRCPERTVDAGNETDIRSVVVLVGNTV